MTARAALQSLLENDDELAELGVGSTHPTNSVDTPDAGLFLVIRWGDTTVAFTQTGSTRVSIWVHDREHKDYGRINAVLHRLQELLPATVHRPGVDGWTLTTADWLGQGPDLFDSGYESVTRYADFNVVSRYTAP